MDLDLGLASFSLRAPLRLERQRPLAGTGPAARRAAPPRRGLAVDEKRRRRIPSSLLRAWVGTFEQGGAFLAGPSHSTAPRVLATVVGKMDARRGVACGARVPSNALKKLGSCSQNRPGEAVTP